MELMNRIRERVVAWQKKRVRTVVFPLAGKLCAVETVEGKRLGQWQADYDGDTPNLKECFLSLKAAGLRGREALAFGECGVASMEQEKISADDGRGIC